MNKKVSKADKSRTLLRYSNNSITYDVIFIKLAMQTKRIAVCVANCTLHPYLDVRDMRISMDFASDG